MPRCPSRAGLGRSPGTKPCTARRTGPTRPCPSRTRPTCRAERCLPPGRTSASSSSSAPCRTTETVRAMPCCFPFPFVSSRSRFPPVVGHERPLAELPEALPGGVLLPDAALVLPESEAGVVIGELGRPIRDARHPPQCVAHLISGAARDGARGCGDDDVRGSHLHGVEHEPGRGVEPRERRHPIVRETPIMAELVVLVEQPVDVRLLSVLHHRVRAVPHLVGVAERVPVVVLARALADVLPVPSVHRDARA